MKVVLLILGFAFVTHVASAKEGNEGGGGGNILSAEFSDAAMDVLETASRARSDIEVDGTLVSLESLKQILKLAKVTVSDRPLSLNGKAVDAINVPENLEITFYSGSWKAYSSDERKRLAIHELLGLAKVRDLSFQTSNVILKLAETILPGSDSQWLVCDNESMIINSVEHRSGADSRRFDVQIVIGLSILEGGVETPDDGVANVHLKSSDGKSLYDGQLILNKDETMTVRGTLKAWGTVYRLNRKLPCKEKSARALKI